MPVKYIYTTDKLDGTGIGQVYFSSYRKAVDYVKSHGYLSCDYCSEWVTEMSLPPFEHRATYPTHVSVRKEPLR